jgi:hypothetical protein
MKICYNSPKFLKGIDEEIFDDTVHGYIIYGMCG